MTNKQEASAPAQNVPTTTDENINTPSKANREILIKNYNVLLSKAIEKMFVKWDMQNVCCLFYNAIEMLSKLEYKEGDFRVEDLQDEFNDLLSMYANVILIRDARNLLID